MGTMNSGRKRPRRSNTQQQSSGARRPKAKASLSINTTTTSGGGDTTDLDQCLAELEWGQGGNDVVNSTNTGTSSTDKKIVHNPTTDETNVQVPLFQSSQSQLQSSPPPTNMVAVELMRHLCAGKLSKWFLLETKGRSRLPTLERWLLDVKLEEDEERNNSGGSTHTSITFGSTLNAPSFAAFVDPVLPSCTSSSSSYLSTTSFDAYASSPATQRLVSELVEQFTQQKQGKVASSSPLPKEEALEKAQQVARQLCSKSNEYVAQVYNEVRRTSNLKKAPHMTLDKQKSKSSTATTTSTSIKPNNNNRLFALVLEQRHDKKPFVVKINATHYQKLYDAYYRNTDKANANTKNTTRLCYFHQHVFCLLLRYSSLSGGQLLQDCRGGGMQGAVHSQVFEALGSGKSQLWNENDDCRVMELFASPLNQSCTQYYSAFPQDVDGVFGSHGDFFSIPVGALTIQSQQHHTICEANPPFAPGFMTRMAQRIEEHLMEADALKQKLSFVVVVPTYQGRKEQERKRSAEVEAQAVANANADDKSTVTQAPQLQVRTVVQKSSKESFMSLKNSAHLRIHMVLEARQHGYVEGAQHLKPTKYKESPYDTSVFLLQSKTAAAAAAAVKKTQEIETTSPTNIIKEVLEQEAIDKKSNSNEDVVMGEGDESSVVSWEDRFRASMQQAFAPKHVEEIEDRRAAKLKLQEAKKKQKLEKQVVSST
jgi:hypothetical protein